MSEEQMQRTVNYYNSREFRNSVDDTMRGIRFEGKQLAYVWEVNASKTGPSSIVVKFTVYFDYNVFGGRSDDDIAKRGIVVHLDQEVDLCAPYGINAKADVRFTN